MAVCLDCGRTCEGRSLRLVLHPDHIAEPYPLDQLAGGIHNIDPMMEVQMPFIHFSARHFPGALYRFTVSFVSGRKVSALLIDRSNVIEEIEVEPRHTWQNCRENGWLPVYSLNARIRPKADISMRCWQPH